jgi:hypothetical protein
MVLPGRPDFGRILIGSSGMRGDVFIHGYAEPLELRGELVMDSEDIRQFCFEIHVWIGLGEVWTRQLLQTLSETYLRGIRDRF